MGLFVVDLILLYNVVLFLLLILKYFEIIVEFNIFIFLEFESINKIKVKYGIEDIK